MSPPSTRPSPEQLAEFARQFNQSRALRFFGVELDFPDGERVRGRLQVREEHRGGLGTAAVNGGILAAVFDLVIGCTPALLDPTRRTATMQLSMSFERPLRGDVLVAEAWIDTAGTGTLFASAHIRDGEGQVCARAQGVCKLSQLRWASGVSPSIG